jgi:hypothetical protein
MLSIKWRCLSFLISPIFALIGAALETVKEHFQSKFASKVKKKLGSQILICAGRPPSFGCCPNY